uniref:Lysosomal-trafficking regulator n=1 Tax=Panagrolaimus superbus TaxID=310955 RepID=A0A914YCW7_9BILA
MEPEFLKTLLSTTELWKFEYFRYWAKLVHLTATTLDTCKAKFCEFNSQILHRVDFLTPLLHALLDMFSNKNLFSATSLAHDLTEIYESRDPLIIVSKSLVSSVCTIISELVSSPYRCPAVVQLWNFILLSHPAQDTYLDYTLKGHAEWVRPEDIESSAADEAILEPQNSLLSAFFEKVLMNFDKDKIAELWKETNSATTVRKEILKSENDYRIFAPSAMRLDSLICDQQHPDNKDYWSSDDSAAQFEPSVTKSVDHWLITLRADLISSMCHILLACEDSLMAVIELDVITWKTIIVQLTNQTHLRIRNLIFLLLQNFFLRCTDKYRQEFIKQHGFLILANHLRRLSVTYEIADSLFSIFCGECVKILDGLDEEHLEKMETTCFRYASFHGLFALLEASVTDHALFWTVCSTLQKIFVANNLFRRAMIDCGIVDTMMNVLRLLCVEQPSVQTMIGPVFPLLDCWISFSRSIINLVIPCRDPYMYSRSEDFIWLCQIADYQLSNSVASTTPSERLRKFSSLTAPPPSKLCSNCAKQMVRRALSGLLDCWFDSIQSVVVDSSKMIPVDERYDDDNEDSESDSSAFEIYYGDSHFTSTSYYGDETKAERRRRFEFANAEELSKRLSFGLEMANNLFVFGQIPESMSEKEEMLFQSYIEILLAPWKKRQTGEYHEEWYNVLLGCKERARVLLAQLIAYVLFPVQVRQKQLFYDPLAAPIIDEQGLLRRRLLIVKLLTAELSNNKTYLESLLEVNLDYQYAMKIALHELALCPQYYEIWDEYSEDLERMIKFLRACQLESPLANLTRDEVRSLTTDEVILLHTFKEKRSKFVESLKKESLRLMEKDNSLVKAVSDNAMILTCSIAELQNEPRKFYIQSRKDAINACAKANEVLANLVEELCHPEAPFFDESSWPKGYSLDTTENLRRERKRLKPDHYRFEKKFLQKNRQNEVGDTVTNLAPLQRLRESCPNFATTDYIEASNAVRLSLSANLIRTNWTCSGEIIISERKIHFLGEEAKSTQKGAKCSPVTFAWSYNQLSEIYYRFYLLKDTALELFTTTGDAILIVFATTTDRDMFIGQLKKMGLGHLMADEENQLKLINQQWRRGNITNFDYLMTLNKLAGRSFNDLMQYPVFPFILSDYRSTILDLNASQSFRDLSKPMAIQYKHMEDYYIQNYESLAEENKRTRREGETFYSSMFGAYHYGSHYSNTGIVAHYLVRLSPFTNVALEYQDNNFDIPDRLFNSLDTTWRLSASESTTDFKELIPEFFFLPEMFCNREKLELGTRQAGIVVDNVELPPCIRIPTCYK